MADKRESTGMFFLGAGLLFFLIAAGVVVFAPWLGMIKQMATVKDVSGKVIPAHQYTDAEAHGMAIYMRESCWICHSQTVRGDWVQTGTGIDLISRGGDKERYGPISLPGESAYDTPHMYGTRRIGPDLAREGGKFADAWHLAHFINPQAVAPGSIMPQYVWLYVNIKYDEHGSPISGQPTVELQDLISYIQSRGVSIGDWRAASAPASAAGGPSGAVSEATLIEEGKELFAKSDCVACHGADARGDGPAAVGYPDANKPANFYLGKWKFGGDDATVRETIFKGRPPYMPAHPQFSQGDLAELSAFVRSLSAKK